MPNSPSSTPPIPESSSISTAAPASLLTQGRKLRRTIWALTDSHGWFVHGIGPFGALRCSPDPVEALQAGMAWLTWEVAQDRRRIAMQTHRGLALGLGRAELERASGGWSAISTAVILPPTTPKP